LGELGKRREYGQKNARYQGPVGVTPENKKRVVWGRGGRPGLTTRQGERKRKNCRLARKAGGGKRRGLSKGECRRNSTGVSWFLLHKGGGRLGKYATKNQKNERRNSYPNRR